MKSISKLHRLRELPDECTGEKREDFCRPFQSLENLLDDLPRAPLADSLCPGLFSFRPSALSHGAFDHGLHRFHGWSAQTLLHPCYPRHPW